MRHGTPSGYRMGCRLDCCRKAASASRQEAKKAASGRLLVTCWCECSYVWVPADQVRAGVTGSCGPRCGPDAEVTRADVLERLIAIRDSPTRGAA